MSNSQLDQVFEQIVLDREDRETSNTLLTSLKFEVTVVIFM